MIDHLTQFPQPHSTDSGEGEASSPMISKGFELCMQDLRSSSVLSLGSHDKNNEP